MITIIYKTGKKDSQNGQLFKGKRKNAKAVDEPDNKLYPQSGNEVETVCSYPSNHTCGDSGIVGEAMIYYFYPLKYTTF